MEYNTGLMDPPMMEHGKMICRLAVESTENQMVTYMMDTGIWVLNMVMENILINRTVRRLLEFGILEARYVKAIRNEPTETPIMESFGENNVMVQELYID